MSALSSWDVFDPTSAPSAPDTAPVGEVSVRGQGSSSSLPFFHPGHQLWGFGALVIVTATAMYLATETRGAGAKAEANLGPAHAEGERGIDGGVTVVMPVMIGT